MKLVTFEQRKRVSIGEVVGDEVVDLPASEPPLTGTLLGTNYKKHVPRRHRSPLPHPSLFDKRGACLSGPYDAVYEPRATPQLDYEVAG